MPTPDAAKANPLSAEGAALPDDGPLGIGAFLDRSRGSYAAEFDWAALGKAGLTDDEARCLSYMARVEGHAVLYVPDVLVGAARREYEVASFLATWAYEETQHGRAIDRALMAAGRPPASNPGADLGGKPTFAEAFESFGARAAARLTPHFVATHMAWGAASEMTAALAYSELAAYTENAELRKLLTCLAKDERRHQSFYYGQAARRLARSATARALARVVMTRLWGPVGDGVADPDAFGFIGALLFDGPRGRALLDGVDRAIGRLPGLDGWTGATAGVRASVARWKRRGHADA